MGKDVRGKAMSQAGRGLASYKRRRATKKGVPEKRWRATKEGVLEKRRRATKEGVPEKREPPNDCHIEPGCRGSRRENVGIGRKGGG
jgi:hypothetical protein